MRKLPAAIVAGLIVLAATVLFRAANFSLEQAPIESLPPVEFDDAVLAERLGAAIRIRTIAAPPPHESGVEFEAFHRYLAEQYPQTHATLSTSTVSRYSLFYRWSGSDASQSPILLMAHQDVVPVVEGSEQRWTHPPFSGAVADGFIWGRGALDVKSGVLGILEAVEKLVGEGFVPRRTIYLAFGHDEEIGGRNGARVIAARLASDGIRLEYVLDEGGAITQGIVPDVASPVALLGVAEKGYVSVRLEVAATGGHSSMPPKQTAVGVLSKAITTLEANPFPVRMSNAERFFNHVGPKMPFTKKIVFSNLWLFAPIVAEIMTAKHTTAATLRTTTAATMFSAGVKDNVLPTKASAVVNFRIIPGETPTTVLAAVRALIDDPRVVVTPYSKTLGAFGSLPSPVSDVTSRSYRIVSQTIRNVAADPELVVAPYLVVGATDSRYFVDLSDNVYRFLFNRLSPPDLARIHGTDERISIENYGQTVRFYYHLIRASAGEAGS